MRNIIQEELELAKSKMFEEVIYKDKTLVKVTRDNVAIVEAMIRNFLEPHLEIYSIHL